MSVGGSDVMDEDGHVFKVKTAKGGSLWFVRTTEGPLIGPFVREEQAGQALRLDRDRRRQIAEGAGRRARGQERPLRWMPTPVEEVEGSVIWTTSVDGDAVFFVLSEEGWSGELHVRIEDAREEAALGSASVPPPPAGP